ncbi:DUF6093 family protein [Actinomyces procaprae]|uniref:DUF6093 family protein n=1 Tax=Actinomyces procaprae TaxID=2560010 RepID=UPI0010A29A67|nr:DUF6093 family protein [Actinomyces procaprae]
MTGRRRRRAERLMTDHCTVTRRAARPVRDATGRESWPETTVYTGPCKVQTYEAYETTPEGAGHTYVVQRFHLHVPVSAPALTSGDIAVVDSYPRPFRVTGELAKTHLTAQRVPVDIITE